MAAIGPLREPVSVFSYAGYCTFVANMRKVGISGGAVNGL
jgi:hypothetical protein